MFLLIPMLSTEHTKGDPELDRRTFLRGALGLAGAVAIGACSDSEEDAAPTSGAPGGGLQPAERPTIRLTNGGAGDVGLPNPLAYQSGPGYELVTYVYDSLLIGGFQSGIVPWLITRLDTSPDGRVYTMELRENIRWHDGRPLTPDDVVFSFEYFAAKRPMLPPNLLGRPERVGSVRATGARNVEIRMEQPSVPFATSTLTLFPIVPRHIWSGVDDPTAVQDQQRLIGSGPFRLASYVRGEGAYAFDAVDSFFLGRPFVKRVELRQVGDELAALRAGEIDVASPGAPAGARPEVLAPFRSDPAFGVLETPPGAFLNGLYWNLTRGGALADVRFRQACARAIDRNQLVQRVLGGNGFVGNPGYLPPGHPFRVDVEQYPFDPPAANRLLDDAGYRMGAGGVRQGPDGPLRFRLLTVAPPLAEVVSGMLRAVGVEAVVEPAPEFQQFAMLMSRGNFEMAMLFHGGTAGDPDFMRGVFSSRVPPDQKAFFAARGYANPELDELLERQRTTFDEAERKRIVAQAQQIVARDLPLLHLFYPSVYTIFRKATFDQWPSGPNEPPDKQVLVTGHKGK